MLQNKVVDKVMQDLLERAGGVHIVLSDTGQLDAEGGERRSPRRLHEAAKLINDLQLPFPFVLRLQGSIIAAFRGVCWMGAGRGACRVQGFLIGAQGVRRRGAAWDRLAAPLQQSDRKFDDLGAPCE